MVNYTAQEGVSNGQVEATFDRVSKMIIFEKREDNHSYWACTKKSEGVELVWKKIVGLFTENTTYDQIIEFLNQSNLPIDSHVVNG